MSKVIRLLRRLTKLSAEDLDQLHEAILEEIDRRKPSDPGGATGDVAGSRWEIIARRGNAEAEKQAAPRRAA